MAITERVDKRAALVAVVDKKIEELASAVSAEDLTRKINAYAALQARLYRYSVRNTILIEEQLAGRGKKPTDVAGFGAWLKLGRVPVKGSGIAILAPARYKQEDLATGEQWYVVKGFRLVYVFDAQDTMPLQDRPDLYRAAQLHWTAVDGDYNPLLVRLLDCARTQGIRVEIGQGEEGVRGTSDGQGHIWLNSALNSGGSCGTLLHELSHELCHTMERRREASQQAHGRARLEAEAEASAYCLCGHLGIPRPDSAQYLALWGVSAAELRRSMESIREVVSVVLRAVEEHAEQEIE